MKLTRRVPARTETIRFDWCRKEFVEMSDCYRMIRSGCSKPMDACFWCKHKFVNGEMMALAHEASGRNRILCQDCVAKMKD